jgi:hypothetical protein
MAETRRVERLRGVNPNGFHDRGRHRSAGVSPTAESPGLEPSSGCPRTPLPTALLTRSDAFRVRGPSPRRLDPPWSGWRDLNPRPRAPEARALPSCATTRCVPPARIELATSTFVTSRSHPLSYGGMSTDERTRTSYLCLIRAVPLPSGPRRHGRREQGSNLRRCHPVDGLAGRTLTARASLRGAIEGNRTPATRSTGGRSTTELRRHFCYCVPGTGVEPVCNCF